jgi:hypothetical protein
VGHLILLIIDREKTTNYKKYIDLTVVKKNYELNQQALQKVQVILSNILKTHIIKFKIQKNSYFIHKRRYF